MASKYPSLSGYSYVGGNPVILIDPQGETIQISYTDDEGEERYVKYEYGEKYNGNNQFVANIFAQLDYLMTNSPFETNIVAAIANDKNFEWTIAQITEVAFFKPVGNKSLADGITTMGGVGAASARTTYYEFVGFKTNEGGFQSPISTLYHEAGHAYIKLQQYQLGRQGLMTLDAILDQADYYGKKDNAKFLDNEEEFVNNTYEAPMAHYMGEGIRTSDYGSTVYKTANLFTPLPSTFIGPIAPPIGYFK